MCLGANEPGGPRRCESYMRNVHSKIVALQQNLDYQKQLISLIKDTNSRLDQLDATSKEVLASDRDGYTKLYSELQKNSDLLCDQLDLWKEKEIPLRKAATTALANHQAEIDRRNRMGEIVDERGQSPIDESKPYLTVSPERFSQIEGLIARNEISGNHVDYKMRIRQVPVHIGGDSYHPFLTIEEVDVQFDNEDIQDRYGMSDNPNSMGHNDPNKWMAPTEKVLQAAYIVSDGGREYVSQRNADDPGFSTGSLVKEAVFTIDNGSLVDAPDPEVEDLQRFAQNFPGDTAYAKKVRTLARQKYVESKDAAVLSSAIMGWRQYKDSKSAPFSRSSIPVKSSGKKSKGKYVGNVGDLLPETEMTIQVAQRVPSQYNIGGFGTLVVAKDREGNVYKWNSTRELNIRSGDSVTLRGVVKDHKEYNGIKQTELTQANMDVLHRVG